MPISTKLVNFPQSTIFDVGLFFAATACLSSAGFAVWRVNRIFVQLYK